MRVKTPPLELPHGEKGLVRFSMQPKSHGLAYNHRDLCKPSSQALKCHCQIRRTHPKITRELLRGQMTMGRLIESRRKD